MATIASPLSANSVNNGRRTPFQGFDVSVYIQDQATGNLLPFGEFTGFQHVVRNASEPYLPVGNRTMNVLDGEFQIGWVAEQGKINLEIMRHVFGFSVIGPVVRLGRSPRFQIVVEYNGPELDETSGANNNFLYNDLYATTPGFGGLNSNPDESETGDFRKGASQRSTKGRYVFGYCKIDAFTTGIMAGRTAVADRIEGLAETWYWKPFDGENDKPVAKKITLANNVQTNYFKGQSGLSENQLPSWAFQQDMPGNIIQNNTNNIIQDLIGNVTATFGDQDAYRNVPILYGADGNLERTTNRVPDQPPPSPLP